MERDVRALLEATAAAFSNEVEVDCVEILGESVCAVIDSTMEEGNFDEMFNRMLFQTSIVAMGDCSEMLQEAEGADDDKKGKIKAAKDKFVKFIQDAWNNLLAMINRAKASIVKKINEAMDIYGKYAKANKDAITGNFDKVKDTAIENGFKYDKLSDVITTPVDTLTNYMFKEFKSAGIPFPSNPKDAVENSSSYTAISKLSSEDLNKHVNEATKKYFDSIGIKGDKVDAQTIADFIRGAKVAKVGDLSAQEIIKVLTDAQASKTLAKKGLTLEKNIGAHAKGFMTGAKLVSRGESLAVLKTIDKIYRVAIASEVALFNTGAQMAKAKTGFFFKVAKTIVAAGGKKKKKEEKPVNESWLAGFFED